jgi:hypothetical protein
MWVVETPPTATPKPLALSEDAVQQSQYLTRFGINISGAQRQPPPIDVLLRWFGHWHLSDFNWQPKSRWAPVTDSSADST